jgi:hypothetical protein
LEDENMPNVEREVHSSKINTRKSSSRKLYWLPLVLIALMVWAGSNILSIRGLPLETVETTNIQEVKYDTKFNYRVFPVPSLLYPEGTPLEPGETFFTRLTQDIEVEFNTLVTATPETPLSGAYQVWLTLAAPELWEQDFLLEETEFSSDGGSVEISGVFPLDLQERMELAEEIRREIGVSPRDGHNFYIRPVVYLTGDLPSEINKEHKPEFSFILQPTHITSMGEMEQSQAEWSGTTVVTFNEIKILGWELPVRSARYIFATTFFGSLIGLLVLVLNRWQQKRRKEREKSEAAYINRRYRGRIIWVSGVEGIFDQRPRLQMQSFRELMRIADEREKPIVGLAEISNPSIIYTYYVLDEDNLYTYSVS